MSNDLTKTAGGLGSLSEAAKRFAMQSHGAGTMKAYTSAYDAYSAWCAGLSLDPLSADPRTIALYVTHLAQRLAMSSIRVHLAAIVLAHRMSGKQLDLKHPIIAPVVEGIARVKGSRPSRQAEPAVIDSLRAMVEVQDKSPLGLRNRAMLLIGFGAAMRRSELVALNVGDVKFDRRGLIVTIARSKTDQRGVGTTLAIHDADDAMLSVTSALKDWLGVYSPLSNTSPLFCGLTKAHRATGTRLHDKAVARLIKDAAVAANLPNAELFSGHSLRAGLLTTAGENQDMLPDIMRQSRHRSTEVAMGYIRPADLWNNNITMKAFGKNRA